MPRPHLTFFVEIDTPALVSLFADPAVADFLVRGGHAVSMGVLDLTQERAAIVRDLEARGVPVTAWLLLERSDGYWLNSDNPDKAAARCRETLAWAEHERLRLHRIGLDIEFPRSDADMLMENPRAGLWTLIRRRRSREQVRAAERAYENLVKDVRDGGRTVETYHFPFLLDERMVGSTLLRRTFALVDVPTDVEVYMLYSSYLGTARARADFHDAPAIALGVTGGGVNAHLEEEQKRFLSWSRLEDDLLAAAACTQEVYVFSLEGCVQHDMLARIEQMNWDRAPEPLPPMLARRGGQRRSVARWILRSEPVMDLLVPARRP